MTIPPSLRWITAVLLTLLCASVSGAAEAKLTLHLLDHTGKTDTPRRLIRPSPGQGERKPQFWIDWSKHWRGIEVTKTVTGPEAERLIAVFRASLVKGEAMNFCGHDPIYGVEITPAGGRTLKTSLCFTCGTWVLPGKRYSIAGEPGIKNPLCLELRKIIELPKDVLSKK